MLGCCQHAIDTEDTRRSIASTAHPVYLVSLALIPLYRAIGRALMFGKVSPLVSLAIPFSCVEGDVFRVIDVHGALFEESHGGGSQPGVLEFMPDEQ